MTIQWQVNTQSRVATFQGDNLNVIWSTTSVGKKATVIVDQLNVDHIPADAAGTAAFNRFFYQVTGCTVVETEETIITQAGGRPFSILVPYTCS